MLSPLEIETSIVLYSLLSYSMKLIYVISIGDWNTRDTMGSKLAGKKLIYVISIGDWNMITTFIIDKSYTN